MRITLPITIAASVILHLGVLIGLGYSYFHRPVENLAVRAKAPTLLLLNDPAPPAPRPEEPQARQPAEVPVAAAVSRTGAPASIPDPSGTVEALAPAAPAAEPNPNAARAAPEPETVLNPSPAPPVNARDGIVFVLDASGSMYEPYAGATRLILARRELARQIRALPEGTPFAVCVYAQGARLSGPLVPAHADTREAAVRFAMQDFDEGGGTNLPAGLAAAQQLHPGRLLVVSDGDLNIGERSLAYRQQQILGTGPEAPALSVLAICPRPTTSAEFLLEGLARRENGTYQLEQLDSPGPPDSAAGR